MVRHPVVQRRIASLLLLPLLLAGCGGRPAGPPPEDGLPVVAGSWEQLPESPLLPRGNASAVWTGSELVLWGGAAVDPTAPTCPATADCLAPEPGPESGQVAAYDPATRSWRTLTGTPPGYGRSFWAAGRIRDQSTAYDPATGTATPYPPNDLLVYAQAQVVGSDLVTVGWDYGLGELDGVGQVAAASLDLTDPRAQWRQVEWPLPPPGAESLATATDGTEVLVLSEASTPDVCDGRDDYCHRLLRFAPASGTWTDLGVSHERLASFASSGGHVYATLSAPPGSTDPTIDVVEVDPSDGSPTPIGTVDTWSARLLVSDGGRLAVLGDRDVLLPTDDGDWERLPEVPGDPSSAVFVWAGEDLVVWGGAATAGDPGSRNSADGWVFRPPP